MRPELESAIELQRAGRLAEACALCEQAISNNARDVEALHLLALMRLEQGEPAAAADLLKQAIWQRPDLPSLYSNLAHACRLIGDLLQAIACGRRALDLFPDYPEAQVNLGLALSESGEHEEAIRWFEKALALQPNMAAAHNNLGGTLRAQGRWQAAVPHLERAIELDPAYVAARTNLGQLLCDLCQPADALPHLEEVVRLQPTQAYAHLNLGNVLRMLEQRDAAYGSYGEALRLDPQMPAVHAQLGRLLAEDHRLGDALVHLKRAVELDPLNADYWQNMAEICENLEEPAGAAPCWERVVALRPADWQAQLSLGTALQDEGRLTEAAQWFAKAAAAQPQAPLPLLKIGGLQEELGRLTEAEASIRAALALEPRFAPALARLATLLRGKLPDDDLAAIEKRLAADNLAPGPRARLLFGLAHVLDARANFDRAAACLEEANRLVLENDPDRNYNPKDHEQFVERLRTTFGRELFDRWRGGGSDSRQPIFVFGLPRSGTTLVEQVLASHPQVFGAGELRLARQSFDLIAELTGIAGPCEAAKRLDCRGLTELANRHLQELQSIGGSAARVVDKMPDNYLYLGLLAAMFPKATFIDCRRDVRDVAVSCWMTDFRSIRWANSQDHIAARVQQYRRLMDHWRGVLPVEPHVVRYEESVEDLESVAKKLVSACGLDWHPACLEFYRTERPVRTASTTQVRQPIYRRSLERWRNYDPSLSQLFRQLEGGPGHDPQT